MKDTENIRSIQKVSNHFEYLKNWLHGLDTTWEQSEEILLHMHKQTLSQGVTQLEVGHH